MSSAIGSQPTPPPSFNSPVNTNLTSGQMSNHAVTTTKGTLTQGLSTASSQSQKDIFTRNIQAVAPQLGLSTSDQTSLLRILQMDTEQLAKAISCVSEPHQLQHLTELVFLTEKAEQPEINMALQNRAMVLLPNNDKAMLKAVYSASTEQIQDWITNSESASELEQLESIIHLSHHGAQFDEQINDHINDINGTAL